MDPQRTNSSQENRQEERKRGIPNFPGRRFGTRLVVRAGMAAGRSLLMFLLGPQGAVVIALGLILSFTLLIISIGAPAGGIPVSGDKPIPTPAFSAPSLPPATTTSDTLKPPPNTHSTPMVLVRDTKTKSWSYIPPSQAAALQRQGGSYLEFHGLVNPVVTKQMLQNIPSEIGPGIQMSTSSPEAGELVSLAFAMYSLKINRDNNYRWSQQWADPYYMRGGAGYPGYDVRGDPKYNSFLATAQSYDRAIADNLARRAAIIAAAP